MKFPALASEKRSRLTAGQCGTNARLAPCSCDCRPVRARSVSTAPPQGLAPGASASLKSSCRSTQKQQQRLLGRSSSRPPRERRRATTLPRKYSSAAHGSQPRRSSSMRCASTAWSRATSSKIITVARRCPPYPSMRCTAMIERPGLATTPNVWCQRGVGFGSFWRLSPCRNHIDF